MKVGSRPATGQRAKIQSLFAISLRTISSENIVIAPRSLETGSWERGGGLASAALCVYLFSCKDKSTWLSKDLLDMLN